MCGITGFMTTRGSSREEMLSLVTAMASTLRHRGPDDSGEWADAKAGVALGFRRLSIIDLSPAGHQPMCSRTGRYTIIFNGEVYNFGELKKQITAATPNVIFRGHSDTEVILECVEQWGLQDAVSRFVGMFAFALWDRESRQLHLVRDRLGVKPMYYGRVGSALVFGSELKAFAAHPDFQGDVLPEAVGLLMRFGYVPAPHTIYRDIFKLAPASIATFSSPADSRITTYWSLAEIVEGGANKPFSGSEDAATEQLDTLLRDSVRLRMISDVPLGVFLSGGIDSSIVASIAQSLSASPMKTFTIGFRSSDYDEAGDARRVAEHLDTEHHELYVSAQDALAVIPQLSTIYDEPFADSSQIPTRLISALARSHVTVSLSGDGGDEVFGGYTRYSAAPALWKSIAWIPEGARGRMAGPLGSVRPAIWQRFGRLLPKRLRQVHVAEKLQKVSRAMRAVDDEGFYWSIASQSSDCFISRDFLSSIPAVTAVRPERTRSFAERMMFLDTLSYLPDDILVKVDRASMSVSLESREPLLDHRVVEFAWSLPLDMRIRRGRGKWILRRLLEKYIPATMIDRPKSGFSLPLDTWLRGPLRDWAEDLLDAGRLRQEGIFDVAAVRSAWSDHLAGRANLQHELWNVLMWRAWNEKRRETRVGGAAHARSALAT